MVDRSGDDIGTVVGHACHGDGCFCRCGASGDSEISSASLSADGTLVATVTDDSCRRAPVPARADTCGARGNYSRI